MNAILETDSIQHLVRLVEEATRSTKEGVKNFVPPAQGVLSRVLSKRHHIVFGRRGSGKSSLLEKAAADLTVDRRPIAKVDLEAFKGHSYPDVLLSVLIRTFKEFQTWLDTAAVNPANKTTFWQRLFGTVPTRPAFSRKGAAELSAELQKIILGLEEVLHSTDDVAVSLVRGHELTGASKSHTSGELQLGYAKVGGSIDGSNSRKHTEQRTEAFSRSKTEHLHRHILEYQDVFRKMATLSGGDSFLLLDDLYHIRRADQPLVLDYFHRIAKGNNLWLKIGTIRHRTNWYRHGDPPVGLKLGDDAEEINLDLTLEKYSLAKEFLFKILGNFAEEVNLTIKDTLTDGARDRLVLASGGGLRGTFYRSSDDQSISPAREEADHAAISSASRT